MIQAGGTPTIHVCKTEEELHDDKDLGPVSGPKVLSSIELAKQTGACTVASSTTDIPDYFPTEPGYPDSLVQLAKHIQQPQFPVALHQFLWQQLHPNSDLPAHTIPISNCPNLHSKLKVHHSAIARFYAPSDICGAGGMCRECIHSTPSWQGSFPRHDTVFVETDANLPGMQGMAIAHILLFFLSHLTVLIIHVRWSTGWSSAVTNLILRQVSGS